MKVLARYSLDSDLTLAEGCPEVSIKGPNSSYLTLRRSDSTTASDAAPTTSVITADLILECENLSQARQEADSTLLGCLDVLSFVTSRMFAKARLHFVVDWTPGLSTRQAVYFVEAPLDDIAEPAIDDAFAASATHFIATHDNDRARTALHWYRKAISASLVEDQFSYLWLALEVAALASKPKDKIPSKCPRCRSALFCPDCNETPLHKRYPGQIIRATVERYAGDSAEEIFESLQKIRHHLMHGERLQTALVGLRCTSEQALNTLHRLAWEAIADMAPPPADRQHDELTLGYVDDVRRRNVLASCTVEFGMPGDPDDPDPKKIPKMTMEMVRPVPASDPKVTAKQNITGKESGAA